MELFSTRFDLSLSGGEGEERKRERKERGGKEGKRIGREKRRDGQGGGMRKRKVLGLLGLNQPQLSVLTGSSTVSCPHTPVIFAL